MTKIVRASLGLPTLREGPQFQNSKPALVIEYWDLVLGICDVAVHHYSITLNYSSLLSTTYSCL
jgi:hypothetical protein